MLYEHMCVILKKRAGIFSWKIKDKYLVVCNLGAQQIDNILRVYIFEKGAVTAARWDLWGPLTEPQQCPWELTPQGQTINKHVHCLWQKSTGKSHPPTRSLGMIRSSEPCFRNTFPVESERYKILCTVYDTRLQLKL